MHRRTRTTLLAAGAVISACLVATPAVAQLSQDARGVMPVNRVLTHREQNDIVRARLQERYATVLPAVMRRAGVDMWVVVSREYFEDPVFASLVPLTTYSSRRRTILVFHDRGEGQPVERISVGRFDYEGIFNPYPTHNDSQWQGLRAIVEERQPRVIGIDMSEEFSHADGISATERDNLMRALGPVYSARVRPAEEVVVGWLETKLPVELDNYRHVMRMAHQVIAEAFSNSVIVPGVTTTEDVVWWMRQRVAEFGFGQWFQPSVSISRKGGIPAGTPPDKRVIQRGDMLHTDFGIVYVGLYTDTQHLAYVLLPGETEAPAGLRAGLEAANRLQDLTMQYAVVGGTGNEALKKARAQAIAEGIQPSIYSHPIGYHGHAAGTPIGMTDYQDGVPGRGEWKFNANTWYSIELNAARAVPEWDGQMVRFALEEDAALTPTGWEWVDGRQSRFYLIR